MKKQTIPAILTMLVLALTFSGCGAQEPSATPNLQQTDFAGTAADSQSQAVTTAEHSSSLLVPGSGGNPWWNDTVFYEVFVRSFYDSDGDGVGDLPGLIEKLDYLNDGNPDTGDDLGVTGIWLMPVTQSPSYHGYDVVDYYSVDDEYGTNEDFKRLMKEAHRRGIRVIVDLVLNHTSREHPWFLDSTEPGSEHRDWYIWSDKDPGYRGPWNQQVWHRLGDAYYYGVFWEGMPDLNYQNPEVTSAMLDITRFWLDDMGVDGFRLDAIKHITEDGRIQENTAATHAWLREFFTFYKEINPEALAVGEAWTATQQVVDYTGDEVDIAFQFDLAEDIINSSKVGIGSIVAATQEMVVGAMPPGQFATFITNHDQNRVLSQLNGDENAARTAASILLTSPGVPFIYYGEEIGMMGAKPDEDIRRPMQWRATEPGAGFTTGIPWRPPFDDYDERNVDQQQADGGSLWRHYQKLIALRNTHEALRIGEWRLVEADPIRLYAFMRFTEGETFLVLLNPGNNEIDQYGLSLESGPLPAGTRVELLFGEGAISAPDVNQKGGFSGYVPLESLPPYSTFVIRFAN